MFLNDLKDTTRWEATRRRFLKTLALIGSISSVDILGPFKKMGFGKEGALTVEEMRQKAMQLFKKPKQFH